MDDIFNTELASSTDESELDDLFVEDEMCEDDTDVSSVGERISDDEVLKNLGIK